MLWKDGTAYFDRYLDFFEDEREPIQALFKLPLGVLAEPKIIWRVSHPSTIQSQFCLTYVFEWELAYPTWQLRWLIVIS
jgi:hypothetical protein